MQVVEEAENSLTEDVDVSWQSKSVCCERERWLDQSAA